MSAYGCGVCGAAYDDPATAASCEMSHPPCDCRACDCWDAVTQPGDICQPCTLAASRPGSSHAITAAKTAGLPAAGPRWVHGIIGQTVRGISPDYL